GWNRLLATLIGGILGAIVALTYTKWQAHWLLFLQLLVTIFLTLWLSKIVKLPPFISRIAVLTLLVVIYVGEDHSLAYVVYRWLATLVGAVVAWLISLSLKND
ncbi:FUSC family protein, partial [Streptococcus sobrinus]